MTRVKVRSEYIHTCGAAASMAIMDFLCFSSSADSEPRSMDVPAKRDCLLWLVVVVQVTVPAVALVNAPAQYGFQMYSGRDWTAIEVLDSHGEKIEVAFETHIAHFRPDIDWTRRLPEYLCEHVPGAAKVTVERLRGSRCLECD